MFLPLGCIPVEVQPFFYGANLVALETKLGGVRPIAVGCMILRCLVAKVAGFSVVDDMAGLLAPHQLGYGVRGGAEAAITCCYRKFLASMDPEECPGQAGFQQSLSTQFAGTACLRQCVYSCPFHLHTR